MKEICCIFPYLYNVITSPFIGQSLISLYRKNHKNIQSIIKRVIIGGDHVIASLEGSNSNSGG